MGKGSDFRNAGVASETSGQGRRPLSASFNTAGWSSIHLKITGYWGYPWVGMFLWLTIWMAALTFAVPSGQAADSGEQARLEHEVTEAAAAFVAFCRSPDVYRYDNLRPMIERALAPMGSILRAPPVPVEHLSPGSPRYRTIVGQMMYLYYIWISRKQRLDEYCAAKDAGKVPPVAALAEPKNDPYEVTFIDEVSKMERELDHARASYGRACGWAWPYVNLRPMCHKPGFEAATILNPFLPVPTIRLSEASPDYQTTVTALNYWEPKISMTHARFVDLRNDQWSVSAANAEMEAAGPKFKRVDEKTPPEDDRLAKMFKIYLQIKPAIRQWRKDQHELEALAEPWYFVKSTVLTLQAQAQAIQRQITSVQCSDSRDTGGEMNKHLQIQALQTQLTALMPQLNRAQSELNSIEIRICQLHQEQTRLASQSDASTPAWCRCCDPFNRLGPVAHHQSLLLFDQWIAEEPRLWQSYFARGIARLHLGLRTLAMEDFKRVENKLRLYGADPSQLAIIMAIRAYTLGKQNETDDAAKLFSEARKQCPQSWMVALVRGWNNLENKNYSTAKSDFQFALRQSKDTEAAPHEAIALLLAACPNDRIRDGAKAVDHAAKACKLTKQNDWVCLDTLGAAYAEAGDFNSAAKSADKALKLAPADRQELIRDRIEFYKDKVPYRLK